MEECQLIRLKNDCKKYALIVLHFTLRLSMLCLFSLTPCISFPSQGDYSGVSYSSIPHDLDRKIVSTVSWVRAHECNINNMDGNNPNCIDMTLLFKLRWDYMYPNEASKCQIVRNYNYNIYGKKIMHHLFIVINYGSQKIHVEPWANKPQMYLMEDNWSSSKYNPAYNVYGETSKWMSEVDRRKAAALLK